MKFNIKSTRIIGANKSTLLLTEAQADKYIKASVIPKSTSPNFPKGQEVFSAAIGPIYGAAATTAALNQVRDADKSSVLGVIQANSTLFKVNTNLSELGITTTAQESSFAEILSTIEFTSLTEFKTKYYKSAALTRLNSETDIANIESRLEDSELSLDLTRYTTLTDKGTVNNAVFNKNFINLNTFEKAFYETLAISDIKENDRANIKEILLYYNGYFDADLSTLSDYKLGLAASEILKGTYNDFASLNAAVTVAVANTVAVEEPIQASDPDSKGDKNNQAFGFQNSGIPSIAMRLAEGLKIEQEDSQAELFSDLGLAQWASESILYLADRGIISGYEDGTFKPQNTLLREEFVTMVVNAFLSDSQQGNIEFADVNEGAWYTPFISRAAASGIIAGISENEFGIGRTITREDMAVILYRLLPKTEENSTATYGDYESISDYAKEAVDKMSQMGILNGIDGNFEPKTEATRAMAAKVICDILKSREG